MMIMVITMITMFLCPRSPSCSFSLTKAEMRTRNLPLDHLIKEHHIKPSDIIPGRFKFSKKYV